MASSEENGVDQVESARLRSALTGEGVRPLAPRTGACREAADVAALVSAPEGDPAARAFLTHAAACDYCGPLVEAALADADVRDEDRELLKTLQTGRPEWRTQMAWRFAAAARGGAARRRRWPYALAAALAAAAALLLVVLVRQPRGPDAAIATRTDRPELQELVAAVAGEPSRPVEGRLSGGFPYGPPPTLQRGPSEQASPRVRIAAAKLEEAARTSDTPATRGAVGVGFVAVGDLDKAVDALEEVVQEQPANAHAQSDLSAAYLARAKWRDRPEDWPKALAAAERAIKANPKLAEPYFNRALALEGLHLDQEAIDAWTAYQGVDPSSRWTAEAAEHVRKLKARASAKAPPSNQDIRERIEDQLLAQWGEAVLAGNDAAARQTLDEADAAAQALAKAGGDTMARDEIAMIRRAIDGGRMADIKTFANAHVLYGRARREFLATQLRRASDLMTDAAKEFERVMSPLASWAPIYEGIALWVGGSADQAIRQLQVADVSANAFAPTYYNLLGRFRWTHGVALGMGGHFDQQRDELRDAADLYRRAAEFENFAATSTAVAEAEWLLGESADAWRFELEALSTLPALRVSTRRNVVLFFGATLSINEDLPEVALHFQNALILSLDAERQNVGRPDAYLRRARVLERLNDHQAALADLAHAEETIGVVEDSGLRARTTAELNKVRSELAVKSSPTAALTTLNDAIGYFRVAGPTTQLSELLVRRGKLFESLRDLEHASSDFHEAIAAFERDRARLTRPQDRLQAFEQRRSAFRELARFESVLRHDSTEALRVAESGRARELVERLRGAGATPVDPTSAHRRLPEDIAIVYYALLGDRVGVWVLTREAIEEFNRPISATDLQAMTRRMRRVIDRGADLAETASVTGDFYRQLVAPALALAPSKSVIVFVPEGPLQTVPFAAMSEPEGHPLLASHVIGVAPSLTTFLAASARLTRSSLDDVMAIGDAQDPRRSGLPRLEFADDEARAVARLYPTATVLVGPDATKRRILAEHRGVVHFAGHTIVNPQFPFLSRLLLAPGDGDPEDSILSAEEIAIHRFDATGVVILGSCNGAAGKSVEGEGVVSMARMFLDAGVPSVVASLWPVDEATHSLLIDFHRELRAHRDPATALRSVQAAWLKERGAHAPVRLWAGFVALGGITSSQN